MKHARRSQNSIDGLAVTRTVATMAGWLPPLASALTIIWLVHSDLGKSYDSEHL